MTVLSPLSDLHIGRGYRLGPLTWFPVWTADPVGPRGYVTDRSADLAVSEAKQARVPTLDVTNSGDSSVLIFEGTIFEGGWQHRTVVRTTLVPAHQSLALPVVCVEAGRWDDSSSTQWSAGRVAPARVRSATRNLRRSEQGQVSLGAPDQSRVWREVSDYQARTRSSSRTESMVEIAQEAEKSLSDAEMIRALPGQRGVIVAALGRPMAFELYDHPDTLAERLPGILRGFALDAMGQPYVETPSRRPRQFAEVVSRVPVTESDRDHATLRRRSIENPAIATEAIFTSDDSLLHLLAFNARHELVLAA